MQHALVYGLVEIYHLWYDVKFVYQEVRDDMFFF